MLKTVDLVEKIGKEYEPMLKAINIPDFYKCIAQYSGISIIDLKDDIIVEYLGHWARNKKPIFDFFGGKTQVDMDIEYNDEDRDYYGMLQEIGKKYPAYYNWLVSMRKARTNILERNNVDWDTNDMINICFPDYKYNGESISHFFKNKLGASDQLVSDLSRVYENVNVTAKFTLSIDPTDIMLSSENPYKWVSCYRLALDNAESHADGCLAGVLDKPTIVTYIWTDEGKFTLYETYKFKNIRYKKMRMTIAVNKEFNAIHFNEIYPGKQNLSDGFHKMLRDKVETYFATKLGKENKWIKNMSSNTGKTIECYREYGEYGYSEYSSFNVWKLAKQDNYSNIIVYDTLIMCPCGCGHEYRGTSACEDDNLEYNGYGHTNENYEPYEDEYEEEENDCDELQTYETCSGECRTCPIYNRGHAECELTHEPCDQYEDIDTLEEKGMFDPNEDNIIYCDRDHCANCPHYQEHHSQEEESTIQVNVNTQLGTMTTTINGVEYDTTLQGATITSSLPTE